MALRDDTDDQDTELAWAEEAERRYEELRSGAATAIPSEQVMEEAEEARSRLE